jgi:hypothetical protein
LLCGERLADKGFAHHFAGMTETTDDAARHKANIANRKAPHDPEVASKTVEKGLLS